METGMKEAKLISDKDENSLEVNTVQLPSSEVTESQEKSSKVSTKSRMTLKDRDVMRSILHQFQSNQSNDIEILNLLSSLIEYVHDLDWGNFYFHYLPHSIIF